MTTVTLTVTALGGDEVWGPQDMLCAELVGTLKRAVADKMSVRVEELVLTYGVVELKDEKTFADASIIDGAQLQAVVVDPWTELAERALDRLFSTAVHGADTGTGELTFELLTVPDADFSVWLAGIAKVCGCEEAGLPGDVKAMLEAIWKCGKTFSQRYFSISIWNGVGFLGNNLCTNVFSGPGLLCLGAYNSEYGFLAAFVDLTGAMAENYGALADQYKGAVWRFSCGEDEWGDLHNFYSIDLMGGLTTEKFAKIISLSRDEFAPLNLPYPVSPCIEAFFSKWAADGSCPVFVTPGEVFEGTDEAIFRISEVVTFKQVTKQLFDEKERSAELAKQQSLLTHLFSFLDTEKRGNLTSSDLRPLGEVGGWLTSKSTENGFFDLFVALAREKGFEASENISESAFIECFMHLPFSPDTDQYYQIENGMTDSWALKDYLKTLRAGPHFNGHYLGPLRRDEIYRKIIVAELFQLLDKDGNGHISSCELQPFVELFHFCHPGGWSPAPATPWGSTTFSEDSSMEQWSRQFKDLCEARGVLADVGFSETAFVAYVEEMNIYQPDLAWGAEMIRLGPPPSGHHLSFLDFTYTNGAIRPGIPQKDSEPTHYEDARGVAEAQGYADPPFKAVYDWALQASPRVLTRSLEGVEYSVTAVPSRQGLLDDWGLVERAPKQYKWTLEPNEC